MAFIVALVAACGSKKDPASSTKHDAAAAPSVPPITTPIIGVMALPPWSFPWNSGDKDYDKAIAAYRSKTRDWAAVRAACEAAIAKDAQHYDAHRLLATALAQTGEPAAAVDQFVIVLAADYYKYAPSLADDADLEAFWKTPHGVAVTQLVTTLKGEWAKRTAAGVWLVGRRSTFKWPRANTQGITSSRGELYAYDRETQRYLRLTHTEHQVVGFVRAPDGAEVAVFGFDKVEPPAGDVAPVMQRAWVQALDPIDWKSPHKRAVIAGPLRELAVGYADHALIVETAAADGRWGVTAATTLALDANGKLGASTVGVPPTAVRYTLDEGQVIRVPAQVTAAWTAAIENVPSTAATLQFGGATVRVPESGVAARDTVAVAPDGAHLAFATAVDPCAKTTAPSLYVADAKGALTHILTARSRFDTRWIDATTLAYDDGEGAIRLWDASTGREAMRIQNKDGIALDVLSIVPAPICKQQAAAAAGSGSGAEAGSDVGSAEADDTLPPEEGSGPITAPP